MVYRPLVPCEACARHVVATETCCPFCGVAREGQSVAYAQAPRRAGRAALFTFGAAMVVAGCGSTVDGSRNDSGTPQDVVTRDNGPSTDTPTVQDSGPARDVPVTADTGPDDDGGVHAEYGGPPQDAGVPDDDGSFKADYGAPPPRDGGGVMPLYGGAPYDDWV